VWGRSSAAAAVDSKVDSTTAAAISSDSCRVMLRGISGFGAIGCFGF
jgi:hypothetical protein